MKNKIAFKLTMYFSIALLIFSIIIGTVFMALFKKNTIELQKSDLKKRASTISANLSDFNNNIDSSFKGKQGRYGAYLRFLGDIAMSDVWIVDENLEIITKGYMSNQKYNYADLPKDADKVVKEVFRGNTTFSEGFSTMLNTPTLTVGTPIAIKGKIVGALLLHTPVKGLNSAVSQGFWILAVSITTALVITVILSIVFAISFTKPLKKMKNSALKLSHGDYRAKTGVRQNDEIGELAYTIDVLSSRLYNASKKSQKLDKLRLDFVANISHELRTPVTVIRGSLEALCDEVVTSSEQVKDYHRQMLSESLYLQRLVNDLLDLSRLQNTDFKIEFQKLSLSDVLGDAVRSAHHIAKQKNVQLIYKQDTHICSVSGDYGRLRQMFLIILDNAVKFSRNGETVTVILKDKTVYIKDNGIGIPSEDLPYIFERFYKTKSEKNKTGTGLGLAIAKQIADRHNASVSVTSEIDRGTEFMFIFL